MTMSKRPAPFQMLHLTKSGRYAQRKYGYQPVRYLTKRQRVASRLGGARGYARTAGYYGRYAPLGTEKKFIDTSSGFVTVAATGNIRENSIHKVPSGSGESERIGRKINVTSFHLKYVVKLASTALLGSTDDGIRVIVYHDKQCNGASIAVLDLLETATYLSYNNLSNKNRFTILYDEYTDISATAGSSDATTRGFGEHAITKQFHKRCNLPVEFSSTTGGIGEIRSNNIGVLAITDGGIIQMSHNIRCRYSDS